MFSFRCCRPLCPSSTRLLVIGLYEWHIMTAREYSPFGDQNSLMNALVIRMRTAFRAKVFSSSSHFPEASSITIRPCIGLCGPTDTRSTRTTWRVFWLAQTEQAFLAIAQGNAPKDPTVKIPAYDSSSRARATSLERQQLTKRAKHHNKSVKVEIM